MDKLEKLLAKRFARERDWLLGKQKMEIEELEFKQHEIERTMLFLAEKYPQLEHDLIRLLR